MKNKKILTMLVTMFLVFGVFVGFKTPVKAAAQEVIVTGVLKSDNAVPYTSGVYSDLDAALNNTFVDWDMNPTIRLLGDFTHNGDLMLPGLGSIGFDLNGYDLNIVGKLSITKNSEIGFFYGKLTMESMYVALDGGSYASFDINNYVDAIVYGEVRIEGNGASTADLFVNVDYESTLIIYGDVVVSDVGQETYTLKARGNAAIDVLGNFTSTGQGPYAQVNSSIYVDGNVNVSGEFGAHAYDGSEVYIKGNLTADDLGVRSIYGAANGPSSVYVDGTITAYDFAYIDGAVFGPNSNSVPTDLPGYLMYAGADGSRLYNRAPEINWVSLTANGASGTVTTTELYLTFDDDPGTGLTLPKITLIGATAVSIDGTGNTRTLTISNITVLNGEVVIVLISDIEGFDLQATADDMAVYDVPVYVRDGNGNKPNPNTGDISNTTIVMMLGLISLCCSAYVLKAKKRV